MEEGAQLTVAAWQQQQQQQSVTDTAASTRSANEEAFDSVRQAAVVMFKQRTKDLTRLSQVEERCQAIEAELHQAQASATQLAAQQASLEALVEEEQQSTRQRESRLQELHTTFLHLDEEQKMNSRLQQAAEVAIGAAVVFIQNFTNPDGRLFHLLGVANAQTEGRSARELQRLLADAQQGCLAAETHRRGFVCLPSFSVCTQALESGSLHYTASPMMQEAVSADDTTSGVLHTLQQWIAKTEWAQHRELASAVKIMQPFATWLSTNDTTLQESEKTAATGETFCDQRPCWPSLTSSTAGAMTEHHWLQLLLLLPAERNGCGMAEISTEDDKPSGTPQRETSFMNANGNPKSRCEDVQLAVQRNLVAPLQSILACNTHLLSLCAKQNLQLPEDAPLLPDLLTTAQEQWKTFTAAWLRWREEVNEAQSAADAATGAEAALSAAKADACTLQDRCAEKSVHHASRLAEVESLKEMEVTHHATAWSGGLCTLRAQRDSIRAISETLLALSAEEAALAKVLQNDSEAHARELHVHDIALNEQKEQLIATQQRADIAMTRAKALEAEYAEVHRVHALLQDEREALLSCAAKWLQTPCTPTVENNDGTDTNMASNTAIGGLPVARCATAAGWKLLESIAGYFPSQAKWAERLSELSSEVHDTVGEDNHGSSFTASVSEFFANLISDCGDAQTSVGELVNEPVLDAATLCRALQDNASGLRLPTDLFVDDIVDADLVAAIPYLRTFAIAEQASRIRAEQHRVLICDAKTEISLLRSELTTVNE